MSIKKVNVKRNVLRLILGILIIIIGIIPIVGGAAILIFNKSADADGYHWSNTYEIRTSTYAFSFEIPSLSTVSLYSRLGSNLFGAANAVQAKWVIEPVEISRDIFTGLTTTSDGINYISRMETEEAVWSMAGPFKPEINVTSLELSVEGLEGPAQPPWAETFWFNACFGKGQASIYYTPVWNTHADDKYLIILNTDGTNNVKADVKLGFNFPVFRWLPYRLIPLGVLICLGGIILIRKGRP